MDRENLARPALLVRLLGCAMAGLGLFHGGVASAADDVAGKAEASNMRLIAYNDLQARSAYQPVIHHQNGRWIAYIGHHGGSPEIPQPYNPLTKQNEYNGTSIVDVTDPKNPRYLVHVPGQSGYAEQGASQMLRVCNGKDLPKGDPGKVYMLRTDGNVGHQIWDTTNPERPALLTTVITGLKGTHKNWWECETGIAYLVSDGQPDGFRSNRITKIYDLSDPVKPRFIRNFSLFEHAPGGTGPMPQGLHGPIRLGNRVYFGYGTSRGGVIQVVDRDKLLKGNPAASDPFAPTRENLGYPQLGRIDMYPTVGAHTTFPVLGIEIADFSKNTKGRVRDFLVVVNESTANECREDRQMVFMVDISDETRPFPVANYQVPAGSGNFCERGGRFGAHASNENFTSIYYRKIVFISYFNAGVRAVDIRNPYAPREAAYYIPAVTKDTAKRCVKTDGGERCKIAIQTNNVEVDDRGYIYIVDRANTGMHILELTGTAREIASFK